MFPFNRGRSDFASSSLSAKKSARQILAENSLGRSALPTGSIPKHMTEYEVYSGIWNGLIDDFFANVRIANTRESTANAIRDLARYVRMSTRKGDIEGIIQQILDEHPKVIELRANAKSWENHFTNEIVETAKAGVELAHSHNTPTLNRNSSSTGHSQNAIQRFLRAFQTAMQ